MGPVLRLHLQQVLTIKVGLTLCYLIKRIAYKHSAQGRLTRAVWSHDSMCLAIVNHEINAFQYFFIAYLGV